MKCEFGQLETPLNYRYPYQLAIAVILSAQCSDRQVNLVTKQLFKKYKSLNAFATAKLSQLERDVFTTGFYRNKAANIHSFAQKLIKIYNKRLPNTIEELVKLPGVGRKTANVIQQEIYKKADGVVVDTHVARISRLFTLTNSTNPIIIERDLMKLLKPAMRRNWSLYLIFLGRKYCGAKKRNCIACCLRKICPASSID